MGIRQLNKMIERYAKDAVRELDINTFVHSSIAIDSSILLYKYRYADKDSTDSHINGFLGKACFYLSRGILPIFVFDGAPPVAKKKTLVKRNTQKQKIESKIKDLVEKKEQGILTDDFPDLSSYTAEIEKLSKQVTYVTKVHRRECKYFLKLLGIPVIESIGEAENTCASLQKKKIVEYTFTEDTDALTFGAPKVLKSAKKLEKVKEIDLEKVLTSMGFNMTEFIDFCILSGCDYCPTIHRVGPITAYDLIKKYKNIETVVENIKDKYKIPEDFDYKTARMLFNQDPVGDTEYDISLKTIEMEKLYDFLIKEKELTSGFYDMVVNRVKKALTEYKKIKALESTTSAPTKTILYYFKSTETNPVKTEISEPDQSVIVPLPTIETEPLKG